MTPNSVTKRSLFCCATIEHLAVGVEEVLALHRLVTRIDVRRHAGLRVGVARRGHGAHAGEERELLLRDRVGLQRNWPIGRSLSSPCRRGADQAASIFLKRPACCTVGRMR